ncbi:hypothetical protein D3C87_1767720 [compost metagenome]
MFLYPHLENDTHFGRQLSDLFIKRLHHFPFVNVFLRFITEFLQVGRQGFQVSAPYFFLRKQVQHFISDCDVEVTGNVDAGGHVLTFGP